MVGQVREEDARGFALRLGKMVFTGGAGEVLSITRLDVGNIPV